MWIAICLNYVGLTSWRWQGDRIYHPICLSLYSLSFGCNRPRGSTPYTNGDYQTTPIYKTPGSVNKSQTNRYLFPKEVNVKRSYGLWQMAYILGLLVRHSCWIIAKLNNAKNGSKMGECPISKDNGLQMLAPVQVLFLLDPGSLNLSRKPLSEHCESISWRPTIFGLLTNLPTCRLYVVHSLRHPSIIFFHSCLLSGVGNYWPAGP